MHRHLTAKLARGVYTSLRRVRWALRLQLARLMYPGLTVGRGCVLDDGVRISCTDGGRITLGDNVFIGRFATVLGQGGHLVIGPDSYVGMGSVIACSESIAIGRDALIAERVTIRDQDHGTESAPYRSAGYVVEPITIGRNVWLGAGVTVTKGVRVGDDAVIGAGSVVTRHVPAGVVAVGVPARVIRRRVVMEDRDAATV